MKLSRLSLEVLKLALGIFTFTIGQVKSKKHVVYATVNLFIWAIVSILVRLIDIDIVFINSCGNYNNYL